MSWTQYSAGVPYPIFLNTSQDLSYVKGRAILATRKHLKECNEKIHLDTTYVQHPKHENDVSIMHLVNTQSNCKVTVNQKKNINCVRMFLGVQYISEISTVDGTSFVLGILEGDDSQLNYQTTLTKPHQERLGEYSSRPWKKILKRLTPLPTANTNKLTKRLGKWIDTHSVCGQWLSYKDHDTNFYSRDSHDDIEWKVYKRTKKGTQLICIDTTAEYQ